MQLLRSFRTIVLVMVGFTAPDLALADDAPETRLTGKVVEYEIGDFHLQIEFQAEDRFRWEYLSAPNDLTGKPAVETIERRDIRPGVVLLVWTEADGSNIVDIFDIEQMVLHANFAMPDGKRFFSFAEMTAVK